MLESGLNWRLGSRSRKALVASTVKHYLPLRRTLRRSSEKRWPTEPWGNSFAGGASSNKWLEERLVGDVMEVGHEEE